MEFLHHQKLLLLLLLFLFLFAVVVDCRQHHVGDLHSWGLPLSKNSHIYSSWSLRRTFQVQDSLMFLYPPSQDSVVQVTAKAFTTCDISDPILKLTDGNSVFNLTSEGTYYFASGQSGRCENNQKIAVSVGNSTGSESESDSFGPVGAPMGSAFPVVFGPIPSNPSQSQRAVRVISTVGSSIVVGLVLVGWIL